MTVNWGALIFSLIALFVGLAAAWAIDVKRRSMGKPVDHAEYMFWGMIGLTVVGHAVLQFSM